MNTRFDSPRIIITGKGCRRRIVDLLSDFKLHRTLLVIDKYFTSSQFMIDLLADFAGASISTCVFSDFQAEPTVQNVISGLASLRSFEADSIVAIGGGSALDVAKIIGVAALNDQPVSDFQGYGRIAKAGLPLIAVPTTAGSGSEASKVAVITDPERKVKMMILDFKLMPFAAVVDPELTVSMPRSLTAHVGFDTLTHAIEAYVSRKANPLTDTLALACVQNVQQHLRAAWSHGNDTNAREGMSLAALQGGMAFTNASVCLVHGMSRPLGVVFGIPHGLSNAVLLPAVTKFSWRGATGRYADIARNMDSTMQHSSDEQACLALVDSLEKMNAEFAIPSLRECCREDLLTFQSMLHKMADDALDCGTPQNNPIVPTREQIMKLYESAW